MLLSGYICFPKYVCGLEIRISVVSINRFLMTVLTIHSFRERHGCALVNVLLIMRSMIWGEIYSYCSFVELLTVSFNTLFSHLDEAVYQDLKITPFSVVHPYIWIIQMNSSKKDIRNLNNLYLLSCMENIISTKYSSMIFEPPISTPHLINTTLWLDHFGVRKDNRTRKVLWPWGPCLFQSMFIWVSRHEILYLNWSLCHGS